MHVILCRLQATEMLRKQEIKQAKKDGAASVKKEKHRQASGHEEDLGDSRPHKEGQPKSKTKRPRCNAVIIVLISFEITLWLILLSRKFSMHVVAAPCCILVLEMKKCDEHNAERKRR
jgi:hypothetical protein